MTAEEIEGLFREHRMLTLTILQKDKGGWRIGVRVPPGAPLHEGACSGDRYLLRDGDTIEEALDALGPVSALPDDDDLYA